MPRQKKPLRERFEEKFRVTPGCWIWTACTLKRGYGRFVESNGIAWVASRFAYQMYVGEIGSGMCVLHKCDNPRCVNPDHLFLGTKTDNAIDRDKKGRTAIGSKNGRALINEEQAIYIFNDKRKNTEIARDFGISRTTVSLIKSRKVWAHTSTDIEA